MPSVWLQPANLAFVKNSGASFDLKKAQAPVYFSRSREWSKVEYSALNFVETSTIRDISRA